MEHLYHGTSTRNLRAILKHGLKPRGQRRSLWGANPSRPGHVYLTQAYAIHFAKHSVDEKGGHAAIIRLDLDRLDPAKLYADEDSLEQFNRRKDKDRLPTMDERTAFYRDTWEYHPAAKEWQASLGFLGNCSHHGVIPVDAISGVAIVERDSPLWWMDDPLISHINYHIMGGFYRALIAYPFEGHAAIEREDADAIAGGHALANLAKVGNDGFSAFTRPLPVGRIIAAAEAKPKTKRRAA